MDQMSESVILLSRWAYWLSSLGIHVVLSANLENVYYCYFLQMWFSAPFFDEIFSLKLSVLTSTASCWIWLENDSKHDLMAKSSLEVKLVVFWDRVNLPWQILFPSLFNMYPPYE